ncbi:hypothetical protein HOY82DRAFT_616515 [Tuber indicum]|nr:hypothetical protein HOY82DRAFT_616515 [Tuber indicum]
MGLEDIRKSEDDDLKYQWLEATQYNNDEPRCSKICEDHDSSVLPVSSLAIFACILALSSLPLFIMASDSSSSTLTPEFQVPGMGFANSQSLSTVSSEGPTQTMNFDEYIKHAGVLHTRTPKSFQQSHSDSDFNRTQESPSNLDNHSGAGLESNNEVQTDLKSESWVSGSAPLSKGTHIMNISNSHTYAPPDKIRITVRALRLYTNWPYLKNQQQFNILLSTKPRFIHQVEREVQSVYLRRGRHRTITTTIKQLLIVTATVNAHNRQLPLPRVAELAGDQPPSSPDISPIEAVWHIMKHQITNHHPRLTTVYNLYAATQAEWDQISTDEIFNLRALVSERIQDVLTNSDIHTSW